MFENGRNLKSLFNFFTFSLVSAVFYVSQVSTKPNFPNVNRSPTDNCWSKSEAHLYFKGKLSEKDGEPFQNYLSHYQAMHRECSRIDVVSKILSDPNAPERGKCKYVVHKSVGGFGNRMQGLLATFFFAILTNRTLIVPRNHTLDVSLLCEPFNSSSWHLEEEHQTEVLSLLENHKTNPLLVRDTLASGQKVDMGFLYTMYDANENDQSFFCEEGQLAIENVTWIMLTHSRFFSMTFPTIPRFRREIERLFPDKVIYSRLARFLLHPINPLWDHITRAHKAFATGADTTVGIQIRTFADTDDWAVPRTLECLTNVSRVLQAPVSSEIWESWLNRSIETVVERSSNPKLVKLFVASMHRRHLEGLKLAYSSGIAKDGSIVMFHSETNVAFEEWTIKQHALAMLDVWLLSFSDILFTSSHSTFGYLTVGLSGLRPYVLNIAEPSYGFTNTDSERSWRTNGRPACVKAPSLEPCGRPAPKRPCKDVEDAPSYVSQNCTISFSAFWQLMSSENESN